MGPGRLRRQGHFSARPMLRQHKTFARPGLLTMEEMTERQRNRMIVIGTALVAILFCIAIWATA